MNKNHLNHPIMLALFCVVVWGVSYAVIRTTVQQIPPLTLACSRHLLGALLLWPLVRMRGISSRLSGRDHLIIFALGLTGISLYFAFENHSLKLTSASHGALIIAMIPLGTELVHAWRRRILPPLGVWIGTLAALGGTAILVGHDDGVASLEGDLLMLGAVASWVAYTFLVQRYARRYPGLLLTRQLMLYGALALLPGTLYELWTLQPGWPDAGALGGFAYLTIICSVIAYDFWNRAVPALGATRTNTLLYLVPLFGVITGVLALDEPITAQLFIGGGLIFGGVLLAQRRTHASEEPCHVGS
jgi:drug/metabolite transporter (DMT)-like permease